MEPFGPASIVALVTQAFSITQRLNDLRAQYNIADLTFSSLCLECTVLYSALKRVQDLGSTDYFARLQEGNKVADDLDTALAPCTIILTKVAACLGELGYSLGDRNQPAPLSVVDKLRLWWKKDDMKQILDQLRAQHSALQFLLITITLESNIDMQRNLDLSRPVVENLYTDASSTTGHLGSRFQKPRYTATIQVNANHRLTEDGRSLYSEYTATETITGNVYSMIPQLVACGVTHQLAVDLYETCGYPSDEVTGTLATWRSLGTLHDFRLAVDALFRNQNNLKLANSVIQGFYVEGKLAIYSRSLQALERYGYNLELTRNLLSEFRANLHTHEIFLGALEINIYDYYRTKEQMETLRSWRKGCHLNMLLEVWQSNNFNTALTLAQATTVEGYCQPTPLSKKVFQWESSIHIRSMSVQQVAELNHLKEQSKAEAHKLVRELYNCLEKQVSFQHLRLLFECIEGKEQGRLGMAWEEMWARNSVEEQGVYAW